MWDWFVLLQATYRRVKDRPGQKGMTKNMRERILEIMRTALPQIDFTSSDSLVDDGILDSLSIVTLLSELAVEYHVIFDLSRLTPENLNSIDAIIDTVKELQK